MNYVQIRKSGFSGFPKMHSWRYNMLGHWEIFLILLLVLLIFGGKKIPEVARGLGKGLREFKKAKRDITDSLNESIEDEEKSVEKKSVDSKSIYSDYKSVDKSDKPDEKN